MTECTLISYNCQMIIKFHFLYAFILILVNNSLSIKSTEGPTSNSKQKTLHKGND